MSRETDVGAARADDVASPHRWVAAPTEYGQRWVGGVSVYRRTFGRISLKKRFSQRARLRGRVVAVRDGDGHGQAGAIPAGIHRVCAREGPVHEQRCDPAEQRGALDGDNLVPNDAPERADGAPPPCGPAPLAGSLGVEPPQPVVRERQERAIAGARFIRVGRGQHPHTQDGVEVRGVAVLEAHDRRDEPEVHVLPFVRVGQRNRNPAASAHTRRGAAQPLENFGVGAGRRRDARSGRAHGRPDSGLFSRGRRLSSAGKKEARGRDDGSEAHGPSTRRDGRPWSARVGGRQVWGDTSLYGDAVGVLPPSREQTGSRGSRQEPRPKRPCPPGNARHDGLRGRTVSSRRWTNASSFSATSRRAPRGGMTLSTTSTGSSTSGFPAATEEKHRLAAPAGMPRLRGCLTARAASASSRTFGLQDRPIGCVAIAADVVEPSGEFGDANTLGSGEVVAGDPLAQGHRLGAVDRQRFQELQVDELRAPLCARRLGRGLSLGEAARWDPACVGGRE